MVLINKPKKTDLHLIFILFFVFFEVQVIYVLKPLA